MKPTRYCPAFIAAFSCAVMLSVVSGASAQTILYSENFTLPDGTTQGTGTPPNWTLSGNPIFWDHFEVRSNQMEANKISIEGSYISKTSDITGFTDVTLSVDLSSAGSLSTGDYIRGFYKLNGGSEVQWFNITGSTAPVTKTFNGISGGSLQVVIRMRNDNGETYFFDNVAVTGNCATNAGTASVSQTVISSGQTVDLALTGHNGTIQWQQSTDNVTFTDIAGGTTTPFTTAQLTGPGVFYFRAKITNVCASFSNVVTVTVNEATATFTTDSLHVNRTVTIGSNTLVLQNDPGGILNSIYTTDDAGGGLQLQSQAANSFNTLINANNNGNILIGTTTTENAKLTVRQFQGKTILKLIRDGCNGPLGECSGNIFEIYKNALPPVVTKPVFLIGDTGNVSIGTTATEGRLTVDGIIASSGSTVPPLSPPSSRLMFGGFTGYSWMQSYAPNSFLRINPRGGPVAIGFNTQITGAHTDYTLSVDGKIVAKKIIATTVGWSDHILNEGHRLLPLSSVRAYIDSTGHLPNVPSETDLMREGLDIVEMLKIQMAKIEELTLYALKQQEFIENLQTALCAMQER